MTFYANGNNIEPMRRGITMPMMILLSWFRAIMTDLGIGVGQISCGYGVIYGIICLVTFWIFNPTMFLAFAFSSFTFFSFLIFLISFLMNKFAFGCFLKIALNYFTASLATWLKSIFCASIFVKSSNLFDLFAFRTSFCLNSVRHGRFSLNCERLCLEPVAVYTTAVGSSYCKADWGNCK